MRRLRSRAFEVNGANNADMAIRVHPVGAWLRTQARLLETALFFQLTAASGRNLNSGKLGRHCSVSAGLTLKVCRRPYLRHR